MSGGGSLGFGIFCRDLDPCRDLTSKYLIPTENNPANIGCQNTLEQSLNRRNSCADLTETEMAPSAAPFIRALHASPTPSYTRKRVFGRRTLRIVHAIITCLLRSYDTHACSSSTDPAAVAQYNPVFDEKSKAPQPVRSTWGSAPQ